MGGLLRIGEGEIVRPDPDGHFRLHACECGSKEVAYTRRIKLPYAVEWTAGCLTCGNSTRTWTVQHHAQIEWNGRKGPSWERD